MSISLLDPQVANNDVLRDPLLRLRSQHRHCAVPHFALTTQTEQIRWIFEFA